MRLYLYSLFFLTVIFWATFIVFVFYVNPYKTDSVTLSIFFVSLFLALLGAFTLLFLYLRLKFAKRGAIFEHLKFSFRQAALFALFVVGILLFFSLNIFTWWSASLYFVIIILLELVLRKK